MKLAEALAARLKSLRESSGLSQQEVAVKADLSMSLVAKLEQGKKADPRASTLLALAGALGVPPGRLLEDLFPPAAAGGAGGAPAAAGADGDAGAPGGNGRKKKKPKKKARRKLK